MIKFGEPVLFVEGFEDSKSPIVKSGYLVDEEIYIDDDGELDTRRIGILKKYINDTSVKEITLKPKDTIYFQKGCSVPRHKVHSFVEGKDMAITIKEDKASVKIYSDKSVDILLGLDKSRYSVIVEKEYFFKTVMKIEIPLSYIYSEESHIVLTNATFRIITGIDSYNYKKTADRSKFTYGHIHFTPSKNYQQFLKMIDPTSGYYHESQILKLLNSTIIDEDMYKSLSEMLASKDLSTKGMAIDLMANSDFEKSIVYLCALLVKYSDEFFKCRERSSVNFKSLLSYLGIKTPRYLTMESIVQVVRGKNLLTEENKEKMRSIILDYINSLSVIPFSVEVTEIKILDKDDDSDR